MNYLTFKRRAICTQSYNLFFIESQIDVDVGLVVSAVNVASVPMIAIVGNAIELTAAMEILTAVPMAANMSATFDIETVLEILAINSIVVNMNQSFSINAEAINAPTHNADSAVAITFDVIVEALAKPIFPLEAPLSFTIAATCGTPIIGSVTYPEANILIQLVLAASAVIATLTEAASNVSIESSGSVELDTLTLNEIDSNISLSCEIELELEIITPRPIISNVELEFDASAVLEIAPWATLGDIDSLTLGTLDSMTLLRVSIKI